MIETWSIPTWIFFHTLAEKISDDFLLNKTNEVLRIIKLICSNLPCPTCKSHATLYMKTVSPNSIKSKKNLRLMFFHFHNTVNARLRKKQYKEEDLIKYKYGRIDIIYMNFISNYTRKYNTQLLAGRISQNYSRAQVGKKLNAWFRKNWSKFN